MGYSLRTSDRSTARSIRRIARERLAESRAILDGPSPPDAEGLHALRKNIKKLRALLRLVRPAFDRYAREDAALREAGRAVGGMRDRAVMLALFDRLAAEEGLADAELRQRLSECFAPEAEGPEDRLAAHRAALVAVQGRVKGWDFKARGFNLLAPGLERGIDQARRALKRWRRTRKPAELHDLRKRIKAMGYHARLMEPIWPAMMQPHCLLLDQLGETLGDARDHALLTGHLKALDGPAALIARAQHQAAALESEGEALARRLLAEPGRAVSARWRGWWDLWSA